jgi:hypothetical protein
MAGLRPGHPRLYDLKKEGVDARAKRGQDAGATSNQVRNRLAH